MRYQSLFTNEAKRDLVNAIKWYESKKTGLGKIFLGMVKAKVKVLNRQPELFQVRYSEIRTVKLDKFPYLIHYKTEEDLKKNIILAILHTSIDTTKWASE